MGLQMLRDGGMIPQGIGRGNIQTFEPMGKIQMSKGEPIKLSTTHFVFCAKLSRSWLEKVNEWGSLVENERLVTKKMTKIRISMTTFGLAIAAG